MAFWPVFLGAFSAVLVAVLGGVLTDLVLRAIDRSRERKRQREKYGELHKAVYHLADESVEAARQIVNSLLTVNQPEASVRPELLVYAPWEAVRVSYLDLSPWAREVYDLSVFFGKVQAFSELVRRYAGFEYPRRELDEMGRIADALRQAYKDLETAHSNLKKTYWHPDYEPAYFPSHPFPPKPK